MCNMPAMLVIAASLAGCGMKGPLYLTPAKAVTGKPVAPRPEVLTTPDPERPAPPQASPSLK